MYVKTIHENRIMDYEMVMISAGNSNWNDRTVQTVEMNGSVAASIVDGISWSLTGVGRSTSSNGSASRASVSK